MRLRLNRSPREHAGLLLRFGKTPPLTFFKQLNGATSYECTTKPPLPEVILELAAAVHQTTLRPPSHRDEYQGGTA